MSIWDLPGGKFRAAVAAKIPKTGAIFTSQTTGVKPFLIGKSWKFGEISRYQPAVYLRVPSVAVHSDGSPPHIPLPLLSDTQHAKEKGSSLLNLLDETFARRRAIQLDVVTGPPHGQRAPYFDATETTWCILWGPLVEA